MLKVKDAEKITENLEVNLRMAENQEAYLTLPCHVGDGIVAFAFELTEEDLKKVQETKTIYVSNITFEGPLQPIRIDVDPEKFEEGVAYDKEFALPTVLVLRERRRKAAAAKAGIKPITKEVS